MPAANAALSTSSIDVTVQGFHKFIKFNYKQTNKQTKEQKETSFQREQKKKKDVIIIIRPFDEFTNRNGRKKSMK